MKRQHFRQPSKAILKKQKYFFDPRHNFSESEQNILKPKDFQNLFTKGTHPKKPQNVFQKVMEVKPLPKVTSLKNIKIIKAHNIHSSNPQIGIRRTMPHIYRKSASLEYPKQLSLNSQQKQRKVGSKQSKKSLEKHSRIQNEKGQMGISIMKNIKIKQCLSPQKEFKKQYPSKIFRKSTQEIFVRSKTDSKSKKNQVAKQTQAELEIKYQTLNKSKFPLKSKSSCITRNISKNNSKEKDYCYEKVGKKFQKKKQNGQKKLKKQAVYTSMKISRRNSIKFVQTKQDHFTVLHKNNKINNQTKFIFNKNKQNLLKQDIFKTKSLKNLDFFQLNDLQIDKNYILQGTLDYPSFSFKKSQNSLKQKPKFPEISIENFLECQEAEFCLESEESLKQRLTKISLSMEQLKENSFPNLEQLECINQFQASLQGNRYFQSEIQLSTLKTSPKNFYPTQRQKILDRVHVIDWLSIMASTILLKIETFQLAVAYFDAYFYRLIAVACLTLAIKMDERQLENDIFNAYLTLSIGFGKQEIVRSEKKIAKRLKLDFHFTTLSFYLDLITYKWDEFLNDSNTFSEPHLNMHFRSLQGKSYENYRKALEICNCILMDAPSTVFQQPQLVMSIVYAVCQQNVQKMEQEKIYEKIENFSKSLSRRSMERKSNENKENIPCFATKETLDGLIDSGIQENQFSIDNSKISSKPQSKVSKIEETQPVSIKSRISKDKAGIDKKPSTFVSIFQAFVKKELDIEFSQLNEAIEYVRQFSELKLVLEVDPRVYEQVLLLQFKAQTYEEFMRYHSYSAQTKSFVLRRIEERCK